MPREIVLKKQFKRAYNGLSDTDLELVDDALKSFERYLLTRQAPAGLGIKRLADGIYEFRAGLSLRIVYVTEQNRVALALLGTHDEVRLYLKRQ